MFEGNTQMLTDFVLMHLRRENRFTLIPPQMRKKKS